MINTYKNIKDKWQFNILGIDDFNNKDGSLYKYYEFIKKNHKKIRGNLLEAGVHKGKSLLATAILLKNLKSKKIIYAYDTWKGFPKKYIGNKNDQFSCWKTLLKEKKITKNHFKKILDNFKIISFIKKSKVKNINSFNVSTSSDFSNAPLVELKRKIKFLSLDNIVLKKGSFDKTMKLNENSKLMCALIDADLYESYKVCIPYIWRNLSKKGMIFLDEYYSLKFPGARLATNEFFFDKKSKLKKISDKPRDFERWAAFK